MDTFNERIETITAAQLEKDPVVIAKRELAPVRADALAAIVDFEREARRYTPVFATAREKWQRAAGVGIHYAPLGHVLNEASTVVHGGRDAFAALIAGIDNLDQWSVFQGIHRLLPGELRNRRANIDALATLAHTIEYHVSVLEQLIADRAPKA